MLVNKIRIGILGAAKIAVRSILEPARSFRNVAVWGVASRDKNKAETFAKNNDIPLLFSDYDALLECRDIDAVYIPLPPALHAEWIIKTANSKKHVFVEKPICLSASTLDIIANVAKKNKITIVEGIMVQHHPWQTKIKEIIQTELFGKIRSIVTNVSFRLRENDGYRLIPDKGGGVFFDLGSYWVQFMQVCLGLQGVSVDGRSDFDGPNGIDTTFEAVMDYQDGAQGKFLCSFALPYDATHLMYFDKARIRIRDFFRAAVGSHSISIDIKEKHKLDMDRIIFDSQNYYTNQLDYFLRTVVGDIEKPNIIEYKERVKIMEQIYRSAVCKLISTNAIDKADNPYLDHLKAFYREEASIAPYK
jgi:NDP-hexose-3-ketoreductase